MDCRHHIGPKAIGSPCALMRWQDHHDCVVVFFLKGYNPFRRFFMPDEPKIGNAGSIEEKAWHALEAEEVLRDLKVHENGLTSEQAAQRLQRYGHNQLQEAARPGFLAMLWDQLNNFVVILLIVASLVSAFLGEWVDASAILAIVVLNTVLGIIQERRAEEALAALKRLAAPDAHVLRDGHRQSEEHTSELQSPTNLVCRLLLEK